MIWPILFVLGLVYVGARSKTAANSPALPAGSPAVGGYTYGHARPRSGAIVVQRGTRAPDAYRRTLKTRIVKHLPVSRWLLDNALLESYHHGDMKMVAAISKALLRKDAPEKQKPIPPKMEKEVEDEGEEGDEEDEEGYDEDEEDDDESDDEGDGEGVDGNEDGDGKGATPDKPNTMKSPLDGVEDQDWSDFVDKLRTKEPGFKSDKYVGQYEQNRGRLKQLGLSDPSSIDEEYKALVADISNHAQDSEQLINQWAGDIVQVNGQEHPICASGILGLLKYAGPEGAKSWLNNPTDRGKFPKTTEAFLRTNNCF